MDDSELTMFETERIERPTTKRVSCVFHYSFPQNDLTDSFVSTQLASTRRPGGPRQACRPVHNIHLRTDQYSTDDGFEDTDEVSSKHPNSNSVQMNIDPSCFDALDDQLLSSPIDSFADICWADAVEEHESESDRDSPTLYNAPISAQYNDHSDPDVLVSDKQHRDADVGEDRTDIIYVGIKHPTISGRC